MKTKPIPKHVTEVYGSSREFKATKRANINSVLNAMKDLRLGCAFTPAYKEIIQADALLERAKELLSAKNWGR